jgi:hypothetical protein
VLTFSHLRDDILIDFDFVPILDQRGDPSEEQGLPAVLAFELHILIEEVSP